jgi:hypothetical protein
MSKIIDENLRIEIPKKRYKCTRCPKSFSKANARSRHMRGAHLNINYPCTHCGKIYKYKDNLRAHLRNISQGETRYTKCDLCGRSMTKKYLPQHKKYYCASITNIEMWTCDICNRTIPIRGKAAHMRLRHRNVNVDAENNVDVESNVNVNVDVDVNVNDS